jgi:hypothetical protein
MVGRSVLGIVCWKNALLQRQGFFSRLEFTVVVLSVIELAQ